MFIQGTLGDTLDSRTGSSLEAINPQLRSSQSPIEWGLVFQVPCVEKAMGEELVKVNRCEPPPDPPKDLGSATLTPPSLNTTQDANAVFIREVKVHPTFLPRPLLPSCEAWDCRVW